MTTHRHKASGVREECYWGCVGNTTYPAATPCEPGAHGNVIRISRCRCGALRRENINGRFRESSGWFPPLELRDQEEGSR